MKNSLPPVLLSVVASAVCLLLLGVTNDASAQPKLRAKRDISGIWLSYPQGTAFDPTTTRGQPQKVLLTPEYESRYKAMEAAIAKGEADGKPLAENMTRCLPSGMPLVMGDVFPFEIVVTPKVVYVLPEAFDPPVRIYVDGRKLPDLADIEPTYEGISVGHWEGDTLVFETAGVKTSTKISGVPHSDAMRITQRIRVVDNDTIADEITITDPKAFKAPWVINKTYKDYSTPFIPFGPPEDPKHPSKHTPADITEYICNDNNRNAPDANGIAGANLVGE